MTAEYGFGGETPRVLVLFLFFWRKRRKLFCFLFPRHRKEMIPLDLVAECSNVKNRNDRANVLPLTETFFRLQGVPEAAGRRLMGKGDIHLYILNGGAVHPCSIKKKQDVPYIVPVGLQMTCQCKEKVILIETETTDYVNIYHVISHIGDDGTKLVSFRHLEFSKAWKRIVGHRFSDIFRTQPKLYLAIRKQLLAYPDIKNHPLHPKLEPFLTYHDPLGMQHEARKKYRLLASTRATNVRMIDFSLIPQELLVNAEFGRYLKETASQPKPDMVELFNYGNYLMEQSQWDEASVQFELGLEIGEKTGLDQEIQNTIRGKLASLRDLLCETSSPVVSGEEETHVNNAEEEEGGDGGHLYMNDVGVLVGHSSPVHAVAISPNSKLALSGSKNQLILWDLISRKNLHTFTGHSSSIRGIAFCQDNNVVLSASDDKTIGVWDISTKNQIGSLLGHNGAVFSVVVSPASPHVVASGSVDRSIIIWDLPTRKAVKKLGGHTDAVYSVAVAPNGAILLSGSEDKTVRVWDMTTHQEIHVFHGHSKYVNSVAISPDSRFAVSGSGDTTVRMWNLVSYEPIRVLQEHSDVVMCVLVTPNLKFVISATLDGSIKTWDTREGKLVSKSENGTGINTMTISPGSDFMLISLNDKVVRIRQ